MKRIFCTLLISLCALCAVWASFPTDIMLINSSATVPAQLSSNLTARVYIFTGAKGRTNNVGIVYIQLTSTTNATAGIPLSPGATYRIDIPSAHVQDFWIGVSNVNDGVSCVMFD